MTPLAALSIPSTAGKSSTTLSLLSPFHFFFGQKTAAVREGGDRALLNRAENAYRFPESLRGIKNTWNFRE